LHRVMRKGKRIQGVCTKDGVTGLAERGKGGLRAAARRGPIEIEGP